MNVKNKHSMHNIYQYEECKHIHVCFNENIEV